MSTPDAASTHADSPYNAATPVTAASEETVTDLDALRREIDQLDAEILRLVQRRTAVSRAVGQARMAAGGTRVVHGREMAVLDRYRDLGAEGHELALVLLRLGRGRLGRA